MNRRKLLTLVGSAGIFGVLGFTFRKTGMFGRPVSKPGPENGNKTITNKNVKMKTIGILGGIGPQATMDFEAQVHHAARQIVAPLYNSGYPPMVVYYHRFAPVVIKDDLTPVIPFQPDPFLLRAAKNLGTMADFLVITSNGVHSMQREIEQSAGCMVLSMIDVTLQEVKKRKWKKIGVIGYRNAMVYTTRLKEMGIEFETVSDELQRKLDISIMKVMEGRDDGSDRILIMEIVKELRNKNVDGIIPGCTELPFLLKENFNDADMINPSRLLAEAAVRYSLL